MAAKELNEGQKAKALAEKFKVSKEGKSPVEYYKAIKKAAGNEFESIQTLYKKVFGEAEDKATPAVTEVKAEVIQPTKMEIMAPGTSVHGPAMHFHMTPGSVTLNAGDIDWSHQAQRFGYSAVIWAFGLVSGVLFHRPVIQFIAGL